MEDGDLLKRMGKTFSDAFSKDKRVGRELDDFFPPESQKKLKEESELGAIHASSAGLSLMSFGYITYIMYRDVLKKDREAAVKIIKDTMEALNTETAEMSKRFDLAENLKNEPLMQIMLGDQIEQLKEKMKEVAVGSFTAKFKEIEEHLVSLLDSLIKKYG